MPRCAEHNKFVKVDVIGAAVMLTWHLNPLDAMTV